MVKDQVKFRSSPESNPESSPFINIHETMGIKGGSNISKKFGPGVQISQGSKYSVTGYIATYTILL